jgi:hypothetical protein
VEVINTSTNSVGEIDAFAAVVPEPSSLILVVIAMSALLLGKSRKACRS